MTEEEALKCPNCGAALSENLFTLFMAEARNLILLIVGISLGVILGLIGNLWVSFLVEVLRAFIPQALWTMTTIVGLIVTSVVSVGVIAQMI